MKEELQDLIDLAHEAAAELQRQRAELQRQDALVALLKRENAQLRTGQRAAVRLYLKQGRRAQRAIRRLEDHDIDTTDL